MTEQPVPVPFGSGKPFRIIFTALYGELSLYSLPSDPDRRRDIGYSLFNARLAALGLAGWTGDGEVSGQAGCVASFQAVLRDDRLTPVQPFLTVVGDVIARLGRLRLDAIQVTLPERGTPGRDIPGSDWFALLDPAMLVPVRVTLDSPDERIATVAVAAMDRQAMYGDVLRLDATSGDHLVLAPIPRDSGAQHRVTLTGTLAEWSFDALGFLAAFLNDLAASQGIVKPLILNAEKMTGTSASIEAD